MSPEFKKGSTFATISRLKLKLYLFYQYSQIISEISIDCVNKAFKTLGVN